MATGFGLVAPSVEEIKIGLYVPPELSETCGRIEIGGGLPVASSIVVHVTNVGGAVVGFWNPGILELPGPCCVLPTVGGVVPVNPCVDGLQVDNGLLCVRPSVEPGVLEGRPCELPEVLLMNPCVLPVKPVVLSGGRWEVLEMPRVLLGA